MQGQQMEEATGGQMRQRKLGQQPQEQPYDPLHQWQTVGRPISKAATAMYRGSANQQRPLNQPKQMQKISTLRGGCPGAGNLAWAPPPSDAAEQSSKAPLDFKPPNPLSHLPLAIQRLAAAATYVVSRV